MGPRRGQVIQLQTEINTEAELQEWLEKNPGLGIIDVYSGWCGPCTHMAPYLKRIKIEKAENLALAIAKSDTVDSLRRFAGRSEPTWLFVAKGQTIRLCKGVNYPRFEEVILEEIHKQAEADAGNDTRTYIPIATLTPEEQIVADKQEVEEKLQAKLKKEEELRKIEERRIEVGLSIATKCSNITVLIIWPKFAKNFKKMSWLRNKIEEKHFDIEKKNTWQLEYDAIEEFRKYAGYDLSELATESLLEGKAGIWLLAGKGLLSEDNPVEKAIDEALHADDTVSTGEGPRSIFESFIHTVPYPVEDEMGEEEEGEGEEEEAAEEDETETEHSNTSSATTFYLEEKKINGERCPGLWTPIHPIPFARATVLLTLFTEYVTPYIPPLIPAIPPHVAFIFPASESQKVMRTIQSNGFQEEILNYGFFSSDNPVDHQTVANSYVNYHRIRTHFPNEVFVLAVAEKRSFPSITLAELEPQYVSDNAKEGEADCGIWFGPDWVQGKEEIINLDDEEEEEEYGMYDLEEMEGEGYENEDAEWTITRSGLEREEEFSFV